MRYPIITANEMEVGDYDHAWGVLSPLLAKAPILFRPALFTVLFNNLIGIRINFSSDEWGTKTIAL